MQGAVWSPFWYPLHLFPPGFSVADNVAWEKKFLMRLIVSDFSGLFLFVIISFEDVWILRGLDESYFLLID